MITLIIFITVWACYQYDEAKHIKKYQRERREYYKSLKKQK